MIHLPTTLDHLDAIDDLATGDAVVRAGGTDLRAVIIGGFGLLATGLTGTYLTTRVHGHDGTDVAVLSAPVRLVRPSARMGDGAPGYWSCWLANLAASAPGGA